jgi:predicted MarR family transcription regulator
MPELRHSDNAMLAGTGSELAHYILKCLESADLRERLGAAGRATFETELDGQIVCGKMIDSLESLVSNSTTHAPRSLSPTLRGGMPLGSREATLDRTL